MKYLFILLVLLTGCTNEPSLHSNTQSQEQTYEPCEELYELVMEECGVDSYQYWDDFFMCDDALDQWDWGRLTCKNLNSYYN